MDEDCAGTNWPLTTSVERKNINAAKKANLEVIFKKVLLFRGYIPVWADLVTSNVKK